MNLNLGFILICFLFCLPWLWIANLMFGVFPFQGTVIIIKNIVKGIKKIASSISSAVRKK